MIYKKRDREEAGNYRPISILPVIYKLFATVLYARLVPSLHKIQLPDQRGFQPNHRTDDHLMVYRVLEQRCREWGVPLYISTIDFTKAFDRIKHSALWSSLQFYGIKPASVRLLQRLYSQQAGTVLTDKQSDVFPIKRGTKQGDPLQTDPEKRATGNRSAANEDEMDTEDPTQVIPDWLQRFADRGPGDACARTFL